MMCRIDLLKQREQIRIKCRYLRQALSGNERKMAAESLQSKVMDRLNLVRSERVAVFLSHNSEIDTTPLIEALWAGQKCVYLPVIHPFSKGYLFFQRYTETTLLVPGPFGILAPKLNVLELLPINKLDILLMPMVAFDKHGNRLGMGDGYYDRTLSCYRYYPFLPIGVAYSIQEITSVPTRYWDRPVYEIITEKSHIICH